MKGVCGKSNFTFTFDRSSVTRIQTHEFTAELWRKGWTAGHNQDHQSLSVAAYVWLWCACVCVCVDRNASETNHRSVSNRTGRKNLVVRPDTLAHTHISGEVWTREWMKKKLTNSASRSHAKLDLLSFQIAPGDTIGREKRKSKINCVSVLMTSCREGNKVAYNFIFWINRKMN